MRTGVKIPSDPRKCSCASPPLRARCDAPHIDALTGRCARERTFGGAAWLRGGWFSPVGTAEIRVGSSVGRQCGVHASRRGCTIRGCARSSFPVANVVESKRRILVYIFDLHVRGGDIMFATNFRIDSGIKNATGRLTFEMRGGF